MKHFSFSQKGSSRDKNEDSFLALPGQGFFLVADGVGKSSNAAQDVTTIFDELVKTSSSSSHLDSDKVFALLKEGFKRANSKLLKRSRDEGQSCCTAAVVVMISNGVLQAGWIGDCRLYVASSKGKVQQLTKDHSRLSDLVDRGVVSLAEIDPSMRKSALTRVLGDKESISCGFIENITVCYGDRYFLCTDGVTDVFSGSEFATFLTGNLGAGKEICDSVSFLRELNEVGDLADDHTGVGLLIEESDIGTIASDCLIASSVDDLKNGFANEIQSIKNADTAIVKQQKKQSLKQFIYSLPSMSSKKLAGEVAFLTVVGGGVFVSPKIIEILGQRLDGVPFEYFVIIAIVVYILVLKIRLRFS